MGDNWEEMKGGNSDLDTRIMPAHFIDRKITRLNLMSTQGIVRGRTEPLDRQGAHARWEVLGIKTKNMNTHGIQILLFPGFKSYYSDLSILEKRNLFFSLSEHLLCPAEAEGGGGRMVMAREIQSSNLSRISKMDNMVYSR